MDGCFHLFSGRMNESMDSSELRRLLLEIDEVRSCGS